MACHVLVADDEPHIGRIVKTKLEQGPFRVTLVFDGTEALDALAAHDDIKLVLLDLMMPHLGGLEVLERMRADARWSFSPKRLYARVVELTGVDDGDDAPAATP
jgi:two-component system, OmpR family, alkaline phosphatase synthesis response regulator PhoP